MIDPSDPMLSKVATEFLRQQQTVYGTDHYYNCDLFNEMSPPSGELDYLKAVSASVIKSMLEVDPQAVWVMQGWLFLSSGFWTVERAKAFLSSVPNDHMLILDLSSGKSCFYFR